jgi:nucleoside-diphosphate-sugar epimerase
METPTLQFSPSVAARLQNSGGKIYVTGAGGWLGLATLEMLDHALGKDFDRRVEALGSRARPCVLRSGRIARIQELDALGAFRPEDTSILAHYAFLTREKARIVGAEEYVRINRDLTRLVSEQCRRLAVTGTFSTSSGAVYCSDRSLECDLAGNPYGVLKVEEEQAFHRIRSELGARAAVCRIFNVGGPFLNKDYVLGSLINDALFGDALRVSARRKVFRSFAHVADIVSVGFAIMLGIAADPETSYDTAGEEAVEVGELAERIRNRLDYPSKTIIRGELDPALTDDRYVGQFEGFAGLAAAAGVALTTLDTQILDTAAYLRLRPRN